MIIKPTVTFQFNKDEELYILTGPNGTSYQNYIEALNSFSGILAQMSKQNEAAQEAEVPKPEVSDGV